MTDALFLTDDDLTGARVGETVTVGGADGRHAAVVRRIRVGETVLLADGAGHGVGGPVSRVGAAEIDVSVVDVFETPATPRRWVAVQALAKGDRGELAAEMLTELGIDEVVPWQAARSVVRWSGDRGAKSLGRWRATVREAAKQSRRLRVPQVADPVGLSGLVARVAAADLAVILHEEATDPVGAVELPDSGELLLVVGPEGGIAPEELAALTGAGGRVVSLGDGVLRTSTAGVVALAALKLR